jgi:hypothetical protein
MCTITVVGGAVVPVLIDLDGPHMKVLTTGISLLVVIPLSLESVLHFREQWKSYRSTEQTLAQAYCNVAAADGADRGMDTAKAVLEFVDRVESAIAAENATTLNVMTTASEQPRSPRVDEVGKPAAPAP